MHVNKPKKIFLFGSKLAFLIVCLLSFSFVFQVCITSEVLSRSVNRTIIAQVVSLYRETDFGMKLPAYDGRKCLYTAGLLPFHFKEFVVRISKEEGVGICRFVIMSFSPSPLCS